MVDLIIVVLYLILTFVVGIFAGRNVKTMKDFSHICCIHKDMFCGNCGRICFYSYVQVLCSRRLCGRKSGHGSDNDFFSVFVLAKCFGVVRHLCGSDLTVSKV